MEYIMIPNVHRTVSLHNINGSLEVVNGSNEPKTLIVEEIPNGYKITIAPKERK